MKSWMKYLVGVLAFAASACGGGSSIGGVDAEAVYVFNLTQSAEIPVPKPTTASGTATVVLFADRVEVEVNGSSITGVTMAHIHSGAPGSTGPIVITLLNQPGAPSGTINGRIVTYVVNSTNLPAGVTLQSLKDLILGGNSYVNVHTSTNPTGEIRGQIR